MTACNDRGNGWGVRQKYKPPTLYASGLATWDCNATIDALGLIH